MVGELNPKDFSGIISIAYFGDTRPKDVVEIRTYGMSRGHANQILANEGLEPMPRHQRAIDWVHNLVDGVSERIYPRTSLGIIGTGREHYGYNAGADQYLDDATPKPIPVYQQAINWLYDLTLKTRAKVPSKTLMNPLERGIEEIERIMKEGPLIGNLDELPIGFGTHLERKDHPTGNGTVALLTTRLAD